MQIMPISRVKDKLNDVVDDVASTHEHVTITKNGAPAAILVSVEEWESLQETLWWLSVPGIRESLAEADKDIAAGNTVGSDEIRVRLGLPPA